MMNTTTPRRQTPGVVSIAAASADAKVGAAAVTSTSVPPIDGARPRRIFDPRPNLYDSLAADHASDSLRDEVAHVVAYIGFAVLLIGVAVWFA